MIEHFFYKEEITMGLKIGEILIKINRSLESDSLNHRIEEILEKFVNDNTLSEYAKYYKIDPKSRYANLYNLACMYGRIYNKGLSIITNINTKEHAIFYLACCLARSVKIWRGDNNFNFEYITNDPDLKNVIDKFPLKQLIEKIGHSMKENNLYMLKGDKFEMEIRQCLNGFESFW